MLKNKLRKKPERDFVVIVAEIVRLELTQNFPNYDLAICDVCKV